MSTLMSRARPTCCATHSENVSSVAASLRHVVACRSAATWVHKEQSSVISHQSSVISHQSSVI
eukprot:1393409-Prymnesium_polylepis.2